MKLSLLYILSLFILNTNVNSQPTPFFGRFYFNLTEAQEYGELLRVEDVKAGKVRILSSFPSSTFTYDTVQKAFCLNSYGDTEKSFAILHNTDTVYISYPSLKYILGVKVGMPIPLNGNSYAFANKFTYDALQSNKELNFQKVFILCSGCLITRTYKMDEREILLLSRRRIKSEIRFTE